MCAVSSTNTHTFFSDYLFKRYEIKENVNILGATNYTHLEAFYGLYWLTNDDENPLNLHPHGVEKCCSEALTTYDNFIKTASTHACTYIHFVWMSTLPLRILPPLIITISTTYNHMLFLLLTCLPFIHFKHPFLPPEWLSIFRLAAWITLLAF